MLALILCLGAAELVDGPDWRGGWRSHVYVWPLLGTLQLHSNLSLSIY